jgi:ABC-type Fe3+-hydroxamate transport system substrate-binding protein
MISGSKTQGSVALADALGRVHAPAGPDARIVCLVPSITELLFDLGLDAQIFGRTGFCIHPRDKVKKVPKVGGTKDVNIGRVRELAPTHLIVNIDENEKPTVDALAEFVPNVVVTHPKAPHDNLGLYRLLGGIFGRATAAEELCRRFSAEYERTAAACSTLPRERVLYLIWKDPWMTVSRDTYIARTLAAVGWDTVELAGNERYPKIQLTPELLSGVDQVLLSSEPYAFREKHVEELRQLLLPFAVHRSPITVSLIDGEMTSWYGSRAIEGLSYLRELRRDELSRA